MSLNSSVDDDVLADLLDNLSSAIKKEQYRTSSGICQTILSKLPATKTKTLAFKELLSGLASGVADGSVIRSFAKKEALRALGLFQVYIMGAVEDLMNSEKESTGADDVINVTPVLKHDAASRIQMETKLRENDYFVGYTDVLVITQPSLDITKLNDNGFKSRLIGNYVVLERQLVVGVNHSYLRDKAEKAKGKGSSQHSEIYKDFVETVKSKFKARNYVEPSQTSIRWADASWSWLMTADQFKLVRSCQRGGGIGLRVASWAFPFEKI